MVGSIGQLADQVLAEVKTGKLVKLAEQKILKHAEARAPVHNDLSLTLLKLASHLRSKPSDVSMDEFRTFIARIQG